MMFAATLSIFLVWKRDGLFNQSLHFDRNFSSPLLTLSNFDTNLATSRTTSFLRPYLLRFIFEAHGLLDEGERVTVL